MSIVVSNVFSDSNKGGAAITAATVRLAQKVSSDQKIHLIAIEEKEEGFESTHPFTLASFPEAEMMPPPIPHISGMLGGSRRVLKSLAFMQNPPDDHPAVRRITEAEAVFSKGGYIFAQRPTYGSLLSLWMTAYPLMLASALGTKTAIICSSVGTFDADASPNRSKDRFTPALSRKLNQFILRRVDLIITRDERSYQSALDLGLDPEKVKLYPDIVFSYETPDADRCSATAKSLGLEPGRYGTMTLSHSGGVGGPFFEDLKRTVLRLLDRGVIDELAVVVQGGSSDVGLSKDFVRHVDDERVRYVDVDALGPEEMIELYGASRFLIARRMHSAIFSIIAGTPAFPFVMWGAKVQGVMENLNLSDYLVSHPIDSWRKFAERIEGVLEQEKTERARILSEVERARKDLQSLPTTVEEFIQREKTHA